MGGRATLEMMIYDIALEVMNVGLPMSMFCFWNSLGHRGAWDRLGHRLSPWSWSVTTLYTSTWQELWGQHDTSELDDQSHHFSGREGSIAV